MSGKINVHVLKDWSPISDVAFLSDIDSARIENNFGIHFYNNCYWTSGYVGVGRLYNHSNMPIQHNGKEEVVLITSQYGMDPWKMLEKVITDDEYDSYVEELERNNKFLFKVFYEQPMIKMALANDECGDLLYSLNFINSCFRLCQKGIKKGMVLSEDNYVAKIKGRVNIGENIKKNTSRGRNDRFYCAFVNFTADNLENRILKATLLKCKKIIEQRFELGFESIRRAVFCLNILKNVKHCPILLSDFSRVSPTGMYTYYKPVLQQAYCILKQKYCSFNGVTTGASKSFYTVPYMINMETLFEFYARVVLKQHIDSSKYILDSYSRKWYLQKNTSTLDEAERGIHLLSYCVPDIVIREKKDKSVFFVIDAKYKSSDIAARNDSHQLLSYVLLTGVSRCGFIFPGDTTHVKKMRSSQSNYLHLQSNLIADLKYYEIFLSDNPNVSNFDGILDK